MGGVVRFTVSFEEPLPGIAMPPSEPASYPPVVPVLRKALGGNEDVVDDGRLLVARRVELDEDGVAYELPPACEGWAADGDWMGDWRLTDAGRLVLACIAPTPSHPGMVVNAADAKLGGADGRSEAEGFRLVEELRSRHGWCVAVLTRGDAESTLGRELTDDEWGRLRDDKSWRRGDLFDDWPDKLDTVLSLLDIEGEDP